MKDSALPDRLKNYEVLLISIIFCLPNDHIKNGAVSTDYFRDLRIQVSHVLQVLWRDIRRNLKDL